MSSGGSEPDPESAGAHGTEPQRVPAWALRVMRVSVVFGALMLAWNVWVIRGLVTAAEPAGPGSWVAVVIQTTIGVLLITQGLLYLRRAR
jgi:hypothetical protein